MTRDELANRVIELFPPLAQVEPWDWAETDEGEPVVVVDAHASFTGLDTGVDLTAPIPNPSKIGVLADRAQWPLHAERSGRRPGRDGGRRAGEEQLGPLRGVV